MCGMCGQAIPMPSGSSKRRKRRERRKLRAQEYGGAADGQICCVGSDEQHSSTKAASQSALRARVRQLLKEEGYPDEWLADGDWVFEHWCDLINSGRSSLCDLL